LSADNTSLRVKRNNEAAARSWLSKPSNALALASFLLICFGAVWGIVTWVVPSPANVSQEHLLFVSDTAGKPQQVAIVGKDGAVVFSDQRGLARVPKDWMGAFVSIRNTSDWRELLDLKLVADGDGRVRITLTK
jgi:hypothetical protein